jgi:SAM-dependent methyltransferase
MTLLDAPTSVFICEACGHAQCSEIPDLQAFYDTGYRISLDIENHDQIFAVRPDGTVIYRTDHQTDIALRLLDLPKDGTLLDYGAAKADTLRKICVARPDIQPHVFDVSADYTSAWQGWVPKEAQAAYFVPSAWEGLFDAAMSHFVIEHVADPVGFIRTIGALLRPGGTLLLSMPDVSANPGDMVVADHLNHFSEASLEHALTLAGFVLKTIDKSSFPGAFFALATLASSEPVGKPALVREAVERAQYICRYWEQAAVHLHWQAQHLSGRKAAIYGAGFYGSWIFSRISATIEIHAFLDRNPHLQGATHFGTPVFLPEEIADDIEVLFIGLNPLKARDAIAMQSWLQRPGLQHVWLDSE